MTEKAKYIGTGRRKSSVARIVLSSPGIGKVTINGIDIKGKYENAIKLLWSNELDSALEELKALKRIKPEDLMPNIPLDNWFPL